MAWERYTTLQNAQKLFVNLMVEWQDSYEWDEEEHVFSLKELLIITELKGTDLSWRQEFSICYYVQNNA